MVRSEQYYPIRPHIARIVDHPDLLLFGAFERIRFDSALQDHMVDLAGLLHFMRVVEQAGREMGGEVHSEACNSVGFVDHGFVLIEVVMSASQHFSFRPSAHNRLEDGFSALRVDVCWRSYAMKCYCPFVGIGVHG